MKKFTKAIALCLSLLLCMSFPMSVSAAGVDDATIDLDAKGSLTIYKTDLTNAEKDGVWDSSYVSPGVADQSVYDTLIGTNPSNLGNGETSNGYAIKGVGFTYLKVADIVPYSESVADGADQDHVEVLYGIDKTKGADFLKALSLENGAQQYEKADAQDSAKYFYQSDVLIDALTAALESNATTAKNALEKYVAVNGGTAMPLTDAYGKTQAENLDLGLYLVVETSVPEMVVSTTDPFLVSLPMTSVNGSSWIYDVTLYPKNLTGIPTLEKTLRENKDDTGKHSGSGSITDGYAHTGTASDSDVIDYQLVSTLPSITSESTYLTCYTFVDTLSKGISYNKGDVTLEFFTDKDCTDRIATWKETDEKFTVSYNTTDAKESVMTIEMTDRGLWEINTSKAVYAENSMVNSGFSDCTVRVTYAATMNSDASVVYGDAGNPNDVVLTWKRSSQDYYDTLVDDAHLYTYGIDLTKLFRDGKGDFSKVEFILHNDTDNYFVRAELNENEGIYYVTDHAAEEKDATHFVPVQPKQQAKDADNPYRVFVKGLEDDKYTITEVRTADGYTLLKKPIQVAISQKEGDEVCDIYASDALGLVQNDPRYASVIRDTGDLKNMPQKHLEHKLLTASATVDGNAVNMLEDNGSANAEAPLKVVNTRGFDLPATGDHGVWMYGVIGILLMAGSAACIVLSCRKKAKR